MCLGELKTHNYECAGHVGAILDRMEPVHEVVGCVLVVF